MDVVSNISKFQKVQNLHTLATGFTFILFPNGHSDKNKIIYPTDIKNKINDPTSGFIAFTFRQEQDNWSKSWRWSIENFKGCILASLLTRSNITSHKWNIKLQSIHVTQFWYALHINISEYIHVCLVQRSMEDNTSTQHQTRYEQMTSFEKKMCGSKHNASSLCR